MFYQEESRSLPRKRLRATKPSLTAQMHARGLWLLSALLLLCGLNLPLEAQNAPRKVEKSGDILHHEFPALLRGKSQRALSIARQLQANPKQSKRILTSNRVEWCGAMAEGARVGGLRAANAECINGPADLAANRDALIPTANTPFKTIRVKTNIFAFDDGSNPVATAADAAGQIAQLNADFAPARIRFINNGVNFRASTRFRNPANGSSEISAMKTAFADDPARNLNMYVFEAAGFNPTLLGSGYFPWNPNPTGALGGFFCDNDAFGAGERTATHEIGHCLGLWHPFHGVEELGTQAERCSSPCAEFAGRSVDDGDITGDLCSDTPPTPRNFDCGPPTDDPDTASVNEALDQCNNVSWGTTDYSNFMGYADDNCIDHFSPQQMGLMHGWANNMLSGWLVGADASDPPVVTSPSNAGLPVVTGTTIVVSFSKPMSTSATQSAFRFSPALTGTYAWSNSNQTVTFTPTALTNGTIYQVTILGSAPSAANATLKLDGNFNEASEGSPTDDYAFSFRTGGSPANDMFAKAQLIAGNKSSVYGFNIGATKETNEPNHGSGVGGASVWYKWVPTANGNATFDTRTSTFDTSLAVYTGGSVGTLTKIASNEDETSSPPYTSRLTFRAIANTTYYIAVDGYKSSSSPVETGTISLNWESFTAPPNDNWAQAQLISGATGTVSGTTVGAYEEANEPYYNNRTSGVWYKWTAPASGAAYFDTEGSDFDTDLAIYTGTSISTLTQITTDADSGTGSLSQAPFTIVGGTTYYIAVSGGYGFDGARGSIKLNWKTFPAPANDNFASPQLISGAKGTVSGTTLGASKETGEPYGAGSAKASVWYKWVAPASGIVTFDTLGSGNDETGVPFDTMLSVYTGTTLSALSSVTSNDDFNDEVISRVQWTAVAGTTYFISLDSPRFTWREQHGQFTMNWDLLSAPANDLFANAQTIAGYSGKVGGSTVGANKETGEPYGAGSPKASVWFKWTAPTSGLVIFDTQGSGNNLSGTPFDTILNVYTGSVVGALNSVTSNDDADTGIITSQVQWTAVGGTVYYISVDGSDFSYTDTMGTYALNWSLYPAPANDLFANRMTIVGNSGRVGGNNIGANKETSEPYGAGSPKASIWFEWTAPANGPVVFDTAGSGGDLVGNPFDTILNVFTGTALDSLNYVVNNDDAPGLLTSSVSFDAVAGTKYVISVDGSAFTYLETMGVYVLNWSLNGAPINTPTITSFTPDKGIAGTTVTITGANFINGGTTVKFNGKTATTVTVNSSTQMTVVVPAGATTGPVSATTVNGTGTGPFDFVVGPSVSSFTPTQGVIGTTVTVTGTNFLDATGVQFNNTEAPEYTINSAQQIVVKVPPGATTGKIKVLSAAGTGSSAANFTVGPWVGSFTPASGAQGASVIINGANFSSVTAVKFNSTTLPAGSYTVNSTAKITATVPAGATSGPISVTNAVGTGVSAESFLILPGITNFTPTSGGPGTVVTITGTNLNGATAVKFNGISATFTPVSATSLTATAPLGVTTGKISVTTAAGTGTSAANFTVDATPPTVKFTTAATAPVGTTPANNGKVYTTLPAITGTAADAGNVARVDLYLSRATATVGVFEYWNGSAWAIPAGAAPALATVMTPAGGGTSITWTRSTGLPAGANLTDGAYTLKARAFDSLNNFAEVTSLFNKVAPPSITVNDPRAQYEGSAATPGSAFFNVKLSEAIDQEVRVDYTTTDGVTNGAKAGSDYVAKTGTLIFAPGQTSRTVTINFIGDSTAEQSEPLFLDLKTPVNAKITDSRGVLYIRNDDGPQIFIDNAVTVDEGNSGTKSQNFTVRLSAASTDTVTVDWATLPNTAGPADYTVASGTLTFNPGVTSKDVVVQVKGDTTFEPTETYRVRLNRSFLAIIGDSVGIGYIRNDDVAPIGGSEVAATVPSQLNSAFVSAQANASASIVTLDFGTQVRPATFGVTVNGVKTEVTRSEIKGSVVTLHLAANALKTGDAVSVVWPSGSINCVAD